jgi:Ulp1 family protease
LEKINIHESQFIVGPHFVDNNHWLAMIIDMKKQHFYLIDPKKDNPELLQHHFDQWVQYYNRRIDKLDITWSKMTIEHPIQTDNYNFAIFVMNFIQMFINNYKIEFSTKNMIDWRRLVAETIKKNL